MCCVYDYVVQTFGVLGPSVSIINVDGVCLCVRASVSDAMSPNCNTYSGNEATRLTVTYVYAVNESHNSCNG